MLIFPLGLRPISGGFAQSVKSISGGQSLSGFEQVASQFSDRWMASYSFAIRKDADVLAFRAFVLSMRGRANTVALPAFDLSRGPFIPKAKGSPLGAVIASPVWYLAYDSLENTPYYLAAQPGIGGVVTITSTGTIRATSLTAPVSSGMWVELFGVRRRLSDIKAVSGSEITATVFPQFDITTTSRVAPVAHLAAAASLNAITIIAAMTAGAAPQPGHLFSIGTRLHSVLTVSGAGPYSLGIWPWLREDAEVGVAVNFASPVSEMRFASDGEGADALSSLAQLRFGTIALRFDEAPPGASVRELREDGGYELREQE